MKEKTEGLLVIGYGQLVRQNSNFRNLWFGQIISFAGDWFNLIASASLIAQLSHSTLAIGGLFVVRMLAPFLISPIAGVVADRYNRKWVLFTSDVVRAVVVTCFLLVREPSQVWLLYTLTAVQLAISGFFQPARNAILPDIVSPRELGAANALSSATWSVMLAFGAALGGLVAGTWGNQPAFIIDALTFLISAIFISRIRYEMPEALRQADKTLAAALRQYVDGLSYLGQHPDILFIALHKSANALFTSSGFQVIQVRIAEDLYVIGDGGGIGLGLLYAVAGVGIGIGPIIVRYFTGDRQRPLRQAILLGYIIASLGLLLTGPLSSFGLILVGTVLRGFGGGITWVFSTQLLLQLVPTHVRGRVFSSEFAIFTLMSAIGAGATGAAIDSPLGMSGTLYAMAILTSIPLVLWGLWVYLHQPQLSPSPTD